MLDVLAEDLVKFYVKLLIVVIEDFLMCIVVIFNYFLRLKKVKLRDFLKKKSNQRTWIFSILVEQGAEFKHRYIEMGKCTTCSMGFVRKSDSLYDFEHR